MTEILSFEAITGFKPNTIQLSWSISAPLQANEHIVIKRTYTTYAKDPTEGDLVLDTLNSNITSFEDILNLLDNTYYYYSIFVHNTVTNEYTDLTVRTSSFALSYKHWNSASLVYNLFPEETRALDINTGGDLNRLCLAIGNMLDLYRSEVFVTQYNRLPEKAPDNILDFFSESFGFPAERSIDLNTLRRIGEGIVSIYKRKGTARAIEDFIKLFTEWDSSVLQDYDPNFKLYDNRSKTARGTLTEVGQNFATDASQNWDINQWNLGVFSDQNQNTLYSILSNNSDTLQLDHEPPPIVSDSGTTGQGFDDSIVTTAGNLLPVTGTVDSGQADGFIDSDLSIYPDNYWNLSTCLITSGTNVGQRQIIKTFDSDGGIIEFDGIMGLPSPTPLAVGNLYSLQRELHVFLPSITGYPDNALKGRILNVTAGTNSGKSMEIARNYEFGGGTQIVLVAPFTEPCDNTSEILISESGIKFQDTSKTWIPNQWVSYKLTIGSNEFTIKSNTEDTLTVIPLTKNQGIPETYRFFNLKTEYPTATTSYNIDNQYYVYNGKHSFLFIETIPPGFRGSFKDPGRFLFGGITRSIITIGSVGLFELPIVIYDIIKVAGISNNLTQVTLTDTSANFIPNEFIGLRLNPNVQQQQDFEIISNTTNTITVIGNLTSVSQIGNNYYVMSKLDSIKNMRLNSVIRQFVPHYARPILFHELSS